MTADGSTHSLSESGLDDVVEAEADHLSASTGECTPIDKADYTVIENAEGVKCVILHSS